MAAFFDRCCPAAALAPPLQWALPLEVVGGRAEAMLTWPAEAKRLVLG